MDQVNETIKVNHRCSHCQDQAVICCPRCCGKGYFNWQIAVISWVSLDRCCLCQGKGVVPCPQCSPDAGRGERLRRFGYQS